jgi:hypothetical protein
MLYQGLDPNSMNRGVQVLVPTEDYVLALEQPKPADLGKIQEDIMARRQRQEMREKIAKEERESKELEGCTFAPAIIRRKVKEHHEEEEEEDEEHPRDINTFLEDQKRFDEERKFK